MGDPVETRVDELLKRIDGLSPAAVTAPTLVYFDIIGIAWPIRCLLHLQDIAYDYVPVSLQEWLFRDAEGRQSLKAAFSNGHLPLYVDQEVCLNQSNLILTTLGRRASLMGDSDAEGLEIEALLAHCYDALFHWNGIFPVNMRMNIPDDVAHARLDSFMGDGVWGLVSNGYRNNLDAFARFLSANPPQSGFMVGERLSVADLSAFNVLCNWYKAFDRQVFTTEYPTLDDYIQRIASIPGVADYIRNIQEPTLWFELPTIALRLTSPEELQGLVALP